MSTWWDERVQIINESKLNQKNEQEKKSKGSVSETGGGGGRPKAEIPTKPDPNDPFKDKYGDLELIQSTEMTKRTWTPIVTINGTLDGEKVLIRGRVYTVRGKGKSCFMVIRQKTFTIQAMIFADEETVSRQMVKYAMNISKESIVDLKGSVKKTDFPIKACSQKDVEIHVSGIWCLSRSDELPFQISDAARSEAEIIEAEKAGEQFATVKQNTKLDHRYLDLRTPANQAIFKIQSEVCQLFRTSLLALDFIEIHTPKIIAGASEGGAAVFRLDYMGQPACLAQSPQLYKQIAVVSDLDRVFEIGPVFRAENSDTNRHLCEFVGLDFEMTIKEHYFEVLDVLENVFEKICQGLGEKCKNELESVREQYPFKDFEFKRVRLTYDEGMEMLKGAGHDPEPLADLTTELEKALGKLVYDKYGSDFYILYKYPLNVRPFYTMPSKEDENYSNSYDVFMRGEEIISGAQRVHDAELLTERARICGVPVDQIKSYIDSFRLGALPHGGIGVGLERVVMLYLGLNNVRKASLFPRDVKRLTP